LRRIPGQLRRVFAGQCGLAAGPDSPKVGPKPSGEHITRVAVCARGKVHVPHVPRGVWDDDGSASGRRAVPRTNPTLHAGHQGMKGTLCDPFLNSLLPGLRLRWGMEDRALRALAPYVTATWIPTACQTPSLFTSSSSIPPSQSTSRNRGQNLFVDTAARPLSLHQSR
jgi:hypothetical protein